VLREEACRKGAVRGFWLLRLAGRLVALEGAELTRARQGSSHSSGAGAGDSGRGEVLGACGVPPDR
jgi:hypothetical protein